jgi:hypothetical protein
VAATIALAIQFIQEQGRDHSLNAKGNFCFERTILNWRSGFALDLRRKR